MNTNPVVITAALTGSGHSPSDPKTHTRPVTPEQIAADVVACARAGAAICHIHACDETGAGTMELPHVARVWEAVRAAVDEAGVDVILNLTTSGGSEDDEVRLAPLHALRPELCSFDAGTINWAGDSVFMNAPRFLMKLGQTTKELGIKPEIGTFDCHMVKAALRYRERGFLEGPLHFQLMMGSYGGMDATVENLLYLRKQIPADCTYAVSGVGAASVPMLMAALAMGADGIRVGLEDNLYMKKGVPATNVSQVERAVKLAELANRKAATAAQARELLHFPK